MLPPAVLISSTGQFLSFESSYRFSFYYNDMNSSSSNPNNGFSNFHEPNPILGFNSPPLAASRKPGAGAATTSGSNLSRPRLMKVRKQTSTHNHKFTNPLDSQVPWADQGLGFNQFRSSSESILGDLSSGNIAKESFSFGANRGNNFNSYRGSDHVISNATSNFIVDDMSKLKINETANNAAFNSKVFGSELPDEISKLKIEDRRNIASHQNPINVELQNEMEKMNIKDPSNISSENDILISNRMQELKVSEAAEASSSSTVTNNVKQNDSHDTTSSSFTASNFQSFKTAPSTTRSEKMAEFAFTSKLDDIGAPHVEYKTPDMKSNLFSGINRFETKKESVKDTAFRSKKKKGKLKKPIINQSSVKEDFAFCRSSSEEYSPMDISPYEEKLADNYSRENSITSEASEINDQNNVFETPINEVSETESFKSANENLEYSSDTFVTALDSDESSTATSSVSKDSFTFGASSYGQSQLSETRQHKKKNPIKTIHDSYNSTYDAKNSFFPVSEKTQKFEILKPINVLGSTTPSSSKIAEEACEKWRLRGNQAYNNGDLAKAEDCYTQGVNSVSKNEKSRSCLRALMLCYSNRAAARISRGRMKEALGDCFMAADIDSNFLKVQVRAAHCYLAIGEIENAKQQYMKCLQSRNDNNVDRKVITEASDGLERTQKVSECIKQYTDLIQKRTSEDLECALRVINEALQISTCSEKLIQMKADTLFMLRRYEQVIQMCEKTLISDEADAPRLWRSHLIVKSYFYLGRLDDALEFIKKQDNSTERVGNTSQESAIPLADTIRELLSHKTAGNEAYKSGKHTEAVEHYTAALSSNVESRPFSAICFCNRAAAYRSLGQIADAIADCSLAIALDPNYLKAISRRASLYEMIRDYGQAAIDLRRLVSLLTSQVQEKGGASDRLSQMNELKQTQLQLSNVEEESRKGIPLNMYLILGVESSGSAADIKKAYRKAALRHHPDKAAQSLGRSDDGDDGVWKEIAENVHRDADRLFKMIGEAYAVLSNPSKRLRYDEEEEMRNEGNNRYGRSKSSRMPTNTQNSVYERSGSQHQSRAYGDAQYASYRYSRYY